MGRKGRGATGNEQRAVGSWQLAVCSLQSLQGGGGEISRVVGWAVKTRTDRERKTMRMVCSVVCNNRQGSNKTGEPWRRLVAEPEMS